MTKPWQLAEWKKKRAEILRDSCEICGSTEKLVLHHKGHPLPHRVLFRSIASDLFESHRGDLDIHQVERNACPRCNSLSVRVRKTPTPPWVCIKCGSGFNTPNTRYERDRKDKVEKFRLFVTENREQITEQALAIAKEQHDIYMSLEGTITLCKRCHFLTEKGLVLCKNCRRNWHKPQFNSCWDCLPETRKGKWRAEMNEMDEMRELFLEGAAMSEKAQFYVSYTFPDGGGGEATFPASLRSRVEEVLKKQKAEYTIGGDSEAQV